MEQKKNQEQKAKNKKGLPNNTLVAIIIACWLVFYVVISISGGTG